MTSVDIILAITIVLWLASILAFLYLYRRFAKQRVVLAAVTKDLDRALHCLNGSETREGALGFAANLEDAAIKAKLHQYTTARHSGKNDTGGIPERYRHISTLATHGLDIDAISTILQIPRGETEQLLKLFNLAGQCA